MFRYIALVYEPRSPVQERFARRLSKQLAGRPEWACALERSGLQVWSAGGDPDRLHAHVLPAQAGVILGTLFERSSSFEDPAPATRPRFDAVLTSRVLESRGELLLSRYWGNYVAILDDARAGITYALKDPVGELPCIQMRQSDVTIIFSQVTDCPALGLHTFSIRTDYLRQRVLGSYDIRESPFRDVSAVLPGMRLAIQRGEKGQQLYSSYLWKPQTFTGRRGRIECSDRAATALRATLLSCTHTLVQGHSHPLLQLSGGLDSSLIAACLAHSSHAADLHCYTYFDPRARSDERPWARIVARHLNLKHEEHACDPRGARLEPLELLQPTFEPVFAVGYLHAGALQKKLAQEAGSTALFTGIGGDSILGGDSIALALTDYFKCRGPGARTFTLAAHVARATNLTFWYVLRRALHRWLVGSRMQDQLLGLEQTCSLVSDELRNAHLARDRYPHPWFEHERDVPWSTIRRLGSLLYAPQFYDASTSADTPAAETISPLYAQPVVELCLRIPLYTHFDEGRERGLARRAFTSLLPREILERQWKDRAPGYFDELVRGNREYLRARLLDGTLARERLLNRRAIEAALSDSPLPTTTLPGEILRHLDTELWLSKWHRAS